MDAVEAVWILYAITKGKFVANLFVLHQLFTLTHNLSQQLQHCEGTLGGASRVIKVMSTIGARKDISQDENQYIVKRFLRPHVYFKVLDLIIERWNERFNEESLKSVEAVNALFDLVMTIESSLNIMMVYWE
ncbi:hypothetical protein J6590_008101 [Homalodisca vitripennis]|nr:hypothetical protein J6590_008101 [Homalodisca vitripennis]